MVVDHENTNDVLQNMFIKAWKGLENFREDSQLYTWLYRIATNESLTFLDQQKRKSSISLNDVESGLSNTIKADQNFDANRLEWKLQLAIQQLPEKQRLVNMDLTITTQICALLLWPGDPPLKKD